MHAREKDRGAKIEDDQRERGFAEREQERFRRRGDEWKRNEASEEGGGTKYANELV